MTAPQEKDALLRTGGVAPAEEPAAERRRAPTPAVGADEFASFLDELAVAVDAAVSDVLAGSRIADAVAHWSAVGMLTRRLERLVPTPPPEMAEPLIEAFERDARRLTAIVAEITALDAAAAELGQADVLRDPDRLPEAEGLLAHVRERCRPLPPPPAGSGSNAGWPDDGHFAVKVARAVAEAPGSAHNPFFVAAGSEAARGRLLALIANRLRADGPKLRVAWLGGASFQAELTGAIERNAVEAWRARLSRADALFLHSVEALCDAGRAQAELFDLVEALQRRGAQLVFAAAAAPDELAGLDARLRSRLGSGIVVRLHPDARRDAATPGGVAILGGGIDPWFLDREKVLWEWPDAAAWLVEEAG
jgi:chromosomal replication initiator protein